MHSISIRDIDSKLFNEVGKIFKVKVLSFSSSLLNIVEISSFKFLENLTIDCTNRVEISRFKFLKNPTIDCTNKIMINNKEVIAIKHLILNNVNSI